MATTVPVFESRGAVFQADSCQPLIDASEAGQVRLEALVHGHYPGSKLPSGTLRGIKSVGYWDAPHDQQWGLDWHRNEGIEFTYLETGAIDFSVEDEDYPLTAEDLTITRPWQVHRVGNPHVTAGRLHWVILDVGVRRPDQPWRWPPWLVLAKSDLDELTQMLRHNEQPVWHTTDEVRDCFQRIGDLVEGREQPPKISKLTVLLNELLLSILELLRAQDLVLDESLSDTRRSVSLFLDELAHNESMLGRDWSVEQLAASCGLGVTQFVHYCRQLKNLTPARFLNYCRLNAAARLLAKRPDSSITEIAFRYGFSSSQYFATRFQAQFGVSPSGYHGHIGQQALQSSTSAASTPTSRRRVQF